MNKKSIALFSDLEGQIITRISTDCSGDGTCVLIDTENKKYRIRHHQSCCEYVRLDHVDGDPEDILNSRITFAEEDCREPKDAPNGGYENDSHTWTAYRLKVENGKSLTFWILGESNGYYCETCTFEEVD